MVRWTLIFLFLTSHLWAEVGRVAQVLKTPDAYLMRGSSKIVLTPDMKLKEGDEIFSQNSIVQLQLGPATQIGMAKNSQIRVMKNVVNFTKGIIRLLVLKEKDSTIDLKVQADGVAFSVHGTEFEVSKVDENYDLDVVKGEVEVSSPFIHTFVPEIVKANQGFRFDKKQPSFGRRKFKPKFSDFPPFADRKDLRKI